MTLFKRWTITMVTLDPVHVGVGGTQLGHVDNLIARDKADNLPIFPATALSGMSRGHAARKFYSLKDGNKCCAGAREHCGICPVCRTFGTALEGKARKGSFIFHTARMLLFPVYSNTHGPVWVSSHGLAEKQLTTIPNDLEKEKTYTSFNVGAGLALGRLIIEPEADPITIKSSLDISSGPFAEIINRNRIVIVPDSLFSKLEYLG